MQEAQLAHFDAKVSDRDILTQTPKDIIEPYIFDFVAPALRRNASEGRLNLLDEKVQQSIRRSMQRIRQKLVEHLMERKEYLEEQDLLPLDKRFASVRQLQEDVIRDEEVKQLAQEAIANAQKEMTAPREEETVVYGSDGSFYVGGYRRPGRHTGGQKAENISTESLYRMMRKRYKLITGNNAPENKDFYPCGRGYIKFNWVEKPFVVSVPGGWSMKKMISDVSNYKGEKRNAHGGGEPLLYKDFQSAKKFCNYVHQNMKTVQPMIKKLLSDVRKNYLNIQEILTNEEKKENVGEIKR